MEGYVIKQVDTLGESDASGLTLTPVVGASVIFIILGIRKDIGIADDKLYNKVGY